MKQKRILITGAGTGIGLACARRFLNEGWVVVAQYHQSIKELKAIQDEVDSKHLILKRCDFGSVSQLNGFVKFLEGIELDALVNNAAMYDLSRQGRNRISGIQSLFQVNLMTPALIAEAVIKKMKLKNSGCIVNVSSIAAKYGSPLENVFYGMTKSGLEALTHSLAREGAAYSILVNTLRPGVTNTSFHKKIGRNLEKRKQLIPLRRVAEPEEIADAIYFLCAQNTFITNETLTIAGGE